MTRLLLLSLTFLFALTVHAKVQQQELTILFNTDSYELTSESMQQLQSLASGINLQLDFEIALSGHTDDVGDLKYNDNLSAQRTKSVKEFLIESGINPTLIMENSYGERRPYLVGTNSRARDANRRVEIVLTLYSFESLEELEMTSQKDNQSVFVVDPDEQSLLIGKKGVRLMLNPNTFVDVNGLPVKEKLEVKLTEAVATGDFISQNLSTLSDGKLLASGGMFKLEVQTVSGEPVTIAEGNSIRTTVTTNRVESGMQVFLSETGSNWSPTDSAVRTAMDFDMPPYPRMDFQYHYPPKYRRDLSSKPSKPEKRAAPKAPKTPSKADFEPQISWYQIPFKSIIEKRSQEKYQVEMQRYQKNFEMYQRRYDLYVEHSEHYPKALREYKQSLVEWDQKCEEDSIAYINSSYYTKLKEENLHKYALAQQKFDEEVERWKALRAEKMAAMGDRLDEMGVANEMAMRTYMLGVSELGWINIDRFLKMPKRDLMAIRMMDYDFEGERVMLVFSSTKSVLPIYKSEDSRSYRMDRFPKAERATLLAYKVENGKPMVYYEKVSAKKKSYEPDYEEYTFREFRQLLQKIQG